MRDFFRELAISIKSLCWWQIALICWCVMAVFGPFLIYPSLPYDFAAARGDGIRVFASYLMMHRWMQAIVGGLFHDFSPLWNIWTGMLFYLLAMVNLLVLFARIGLRRFSATLCVCVWISTPFFFNRSIYQHAFPAEGLAFFLDSIILLLFQAQRLCQLRKGMVVLMIVMVGCVNGIYQAHSNLLLTAFIGICLLNPLSKWENMAKDIILIFTILAGGVIVLCVLGYSHNLVAKMIGVHLPVTAGNDTIAWLTGEKHFLDVLKSLGADILLNWIYNTFFVRGLQILWLCEGFLFFCAIVDVYRKRFPRGILILLFGISIFTFAVFRGMAALLRPFFCFIPFIAFTCAFLLKNVKGRRLIYASCIIIIVIFYLGHETSTLYYQRWRTKEQDRQHLATIAHDLWRKYGRNITKPVIFSGGWFAPAAGWTDMRAFSDLPLISMPFTLYSNMSDLNRQVELYMVARESVGLILRMPDQDNKDILFTLPVKHRPYYPQEGYIFEHNGDIVVNLGEDQWRPFSFADYRTSNERIIDWVSMRGVTKFIMERIVIRLIRVANDHPESVISLNGFPLSRLRD